MLKQGKNQKLQNKLNVFPNHVIIDLHLERNKNANMSLLMLVKCYKYITFEFMFCLHQSLEMKMDPNNPLPNFIDPVTHERIVRPAISPYGHVMGYVTCRIPKKICLYVCVDTTLGVLYYEGNRKIHVLLQNRQ